MPRIIHRKVAPGIFWLEIPEAGLRVLCGCPADSVKHLKKNGLIAPIEKNGVRCESGPNAILLSDVSLQKGRFANLAEFPVLQMFYFQGMIIPGHPGNTGAKPILMGHKEQIGAQMEYIYRGNYGLVTAEEIMSAGIGAGEADEMLRMKNRFAFDAMMKSEDMLTALPVDDAPGEIKNGAYIRRTALNVFEFTFGGESARIDLNLHGDEEYIPTYDMGFHDAGSADFAVIHSGDGDGWDADRPCMAGIIIHRGKKYLIDAGPNLLHSLRALGIGVGEIEGIFHTHSHDDHFNGLTILMRSDRKMKYYATPLVRHSAAKKLSALMSFDEKEFGRFFDIHDLEFDAWNDIGGLEVMPVFSPHPVETSIFFFRALHEGKYRSYAHFADIIALATLEKMVTVDCTKSGVTRGFYEKTKEKYMRPADIKKIDAGGGMIHGDASDFAGDLSGKILISHIARPLSPPEKKIGAAASFGDVDMLIPAGSDHLMALAAEMLRGFFPGLPDGILGALVYQPAVSFRPGDLIIQNGAINDTIFLLLTGVAYMINEKKGVINKITSGNFMGELSGLMGDPSPVLFRSYSNVRALAIPTAAYLLFLKTNGLMLTALENLEYRRFLAGTWIFGERLSCLTRSAIARVMEPVTVHAGEEFVMKNEPGIYIFADGEVDICIGETCVETAGEGKVFGEESLLYDEQRIRAYAGTDTHAFFIKAGAIRDIPIVQWKLIELYERRRKLGLYS